jgi:hypothetical protein
MGHSLAPDRDTMTPGFLQFIAQAAELVQTGHADDAETMVWRALEENRLPEDDEGDADVVAPSEDEQPPRWPDAGDEGR